jgi:hypothetical protein
MGETEQQTAARNARLDQLVTATKEYTVKTRKQLQDQAAFAKRVLKGRTGMERLNNETVQAASQLVVDKIDEFLGG